MAGIYVHIPFCSSRCIYCDFYSTTFGLSMREDYVHALCEELISRSDELESQEICTLYFGGGTPSLLTLDQLGKIIHTLSNHYHFSVSPEITLESNPDDVTEDLARGWRALGFNRVSLGVQTFQDDILKILRRRHTSATACEAVRLLREAGFENLTLDLIYGLPGQTFEIWQQDVQRILQQPIQHLSSYALSFEPGTAITKMKDRKEIQEADEETIRRMYLYLIEATQAAGFEHYEISNFAKPGFASQHNSSYWHGIPYLGAGPGAHSYDGKNVRRANSPDLKKYIQQIGNPPHTLEKLSPVQLYEEYLLTGLRTAQGISSEFVKEEFGMKVWHRMQRLAESHLQKGNLKQNGDQISLTLEGILISDYIISDLMVAGDD